jgi:hypothetical protein
VPAFSITLTAMRYDSNQLRTIIARSHVRETLQRTRFLAENPGKRAFRHEQKMSAERSALIPAQSSNKPLMIASV